MTRVLVFEGWRHISHSYAMVHQWQLLALGSQKKINLRCVDAPYFLPQWQPRKGFFLAEQDAKLQALLAPQENDIVINYSEHTREYKEDIVVNDKGYKHIIVWNDYNDFSGFVQLTWGTHFCENKWLPMNFNFKEVIGNIYENPELIEN